MKKWGWQWWSAVCVFLFLLGSFLYVNRYRVQEELELFLLPSSISCERDFVRPRYIAHGAGEVDGKKKTNSLEALNSSYEFGVRFFELDFSWTLDGCLVAIHDWESTQQAFFEGSAGPVTESVFEGSSMRGGLTSLTFRRLAKWLDAHPDAYIVTDIKERNLAGLAWVATHYPHCIRQLIPQIYRFSQVTAVRRLGYKNIIMTLYCSSYSDRAVLRFAKTQKPFAITMPPSRAMTLLPRRLSESGTPVYSHGVNDVVQQRLLFETGVTGLYTSSLFKSLGSGSQ